MSTKPVQISMDEGLLERIDADPQAKKKGRSAFIRAAVELYLKAKQRRAIDQTITRAYGGQGDELVAEIEQFIEAQTWPER